MSFFMLNTKEDILKRMWLTRQLMDPIDFIVWFFLQWKCGTT